MTEFIEIVVISPGYINIQIWVNMTKSEKILLVGVTANLLFEKIILSNTQ